MFYQLSPAGNPISLASEALSEQQISNLFTPMNVNLYGSGAMALAAAIGSIVKNSNVQQPEILLPAYGCPELISAILFAGAKPRLVDLAPQRPWLDLHDLKRKLAANTVAIIAVNLFGISERYEQLRNLIADTQIKIIEDSAQSFPTQLNKHAWHGDLVILSFGRGKPVSLLGGGAVLTQNPTYQAALPAPNVTAGNSSLLETVSYQIKVALYNILLSPYFYWLPNAMPFLKLGDVAYHPMHELTNFPPSHLRLLRSNIDRYSHRYGDVQRKLASMLAQMKSHRIVDVAAVCDSGQSALVRYPLLAGDNTMREKLVRLLDGDGLGVSRMYQRPLNELPALDAMLSGQGPFPNAKHFADTLFTLPTHQYLTSCHVARVRDILTSID